ncbi:hypothetical protein DFH08DRAFT_824138 [Mycena albidolilacea]|uniref:Uncharacterized protein n=1 Tax=Mycena albidolilacea TaxID=1033008 RepID=A0AAD7EAY9_9AGAR|nr:hypothetical protein DFH08DRAFT_824138 [Mycena albidolilacea]
MSFIEPEYWSYGRGTMTMFTGLLSRLHHVRTIRPFIFRRQRLPNDGPSVSYQTLHLSPPPLLRVPLSTAIRPAEIDVCAVPGFRATAPYRALCYQIDGILRSRAIVRTSAPRPRILAGIRLSPYRISDIRWRARCGRDAATSPITCSSPIGVLTPHHIGSASLALHRRDTAPHLTPPVSRACLMNGGGRRDSLTGSQAASGRRKWCKKATVLQKLFQSVPLNDDTPYSGSLDT